MPRPWRRRMTSSRCQDDRDELYLHEALILTQEARSPDAGQGCALATWVRRSRGGLLPVRARHQSGVRFETTIVIELANDYTGYIPTLAAFEEGGYETWLARSSKLEPAAGPRMAETAIRLLAELRPA